VSELLQNGRLLEMLKEPATGTGIRSAPVSRVVTGSSGIMPKHGRRQFGAATVDRLSMDWPTVNLSADEVVGRDLQKLRGRSRWLASNNGYYKRYLRLNVQNIVGPKGVKIDAKVKLDAKRFDKLANTAIETAWAQWSKKGVPLFGSQWTRRDLERAIVWNVVRDGEVFLRKRYGAGPFGFQIEMIDPMRVSTQINRILRDGAEIINGIEYDADKVPVAYWILKKGMRSDYTGETAIRTEAKYIEHIFFPSEAEQKRGWPWMATAMQRVHMLDKYEAAEVATARLAAEKGGFFKQSVPDADDYAGDDEEGSSEIEFLDSQAATFGVLPPGFEFQQYDPTHPTTAFDAFSTKLLRGIASAGDVNYTSLANDLSDVNYSSARIGMLEVRDNWQEKQQWLTEWVHEPIFPEWLKMAMAAGKIKLPFSRFEEFVAAVSWIPRSWAWVDPQKEAVGNREAVGLRAKSLGEVCQDRGVEFEEVIDSLVKEKEYAESAGIDMSAIFGVPTKGGAADEARSLKARIEALELALEEAGERSVTKKLNGHAYAKD